jgi:hypothetical protein
MAQRTGGPEGTPSEDAVEHDFTVPADADLESGDDEAQPA